MLKNTMFIKNLRNNTLLNIYIDTKIIRLFIKD